MNSETLFSAIFRLHPFPIAITSLQGGRILQVNEQALKAFGYSYEEVIAQTTTQLNIWQHPHEREELTQRLIQEQRVQGFEATFRTKQGKLWTAVNSVELIHVEGESCILWIMQDITERRKGEEAINSYTQQLEDLNASKDKFFSVIAHDLLSPLNGILGSSHLLTTYIENLSKQDIQELSQRIYDSTSNLKRLLSNLLEWARMQTGGMAFEPKLIHFKQILTEVIDLLQDIAQKKGITIQITLAEDIIFEADEHMLHSILRNLLSNSIKFSNTGTCITVSAKKLPTHIQLRILAILSQ